MSQVEAVHNCVCVGLDIVFGPSGRKADTGRVKNVFSDGKLWEDDIILWNVADDLLVVLHLGRDAVYFYGPTSMCCFAHEHVHKGSCAPVSCRA